MAERGRRGDARARSPRPRIDFLLREARADDARAIAAVQVTGWRETYSDWLSAEFFAGVSVARHAERIAGRMALPGVRTVVAEVDGEIVGYSASGDPRDPDAPLDVELYAIYQLSLLHGTGSGKAMLDAAVGDGPAYLWVLERNLHAQGFYRRSGFELDGARRGLDYFEGLVEVRMRRG